jgi:hypothetical protein
MSTWISVGEAVAQSIYSHEHIYHLARTGKIKSRKSGSIWLVELESLKEYEFRMKELGPQKFDPTRDNTPI